MDQFCTKAFTNSYKARMGFGRANIMSVFPIFVEEGWKNRHIGEVFFSLKNVRGPKTQNRKLVEVTG